MLAVVSLLAVMTVSIVITRIATVVLTVTGRAAGEAGWDAHRSAVAAYTALRDAEEQAELAGRPGA